MKPLALALCLAFASCYHVQQVADDACAVTPGILAAVDAALGAPDDRYVAEVAAVAAAFCAVRSAVEQVANLAGQKVANKLEPDVAAERKFMHATIWLEAHRSGS